MSSNGDDTVRVEVPAHEVEPPRPTTPRRIVIWILIIAAAALAGTLLLPGGYDAKTVPDSMVGEWVSDNPEYSDRYITLATDSITFGVGGTSSVKYKILGIRTEESDGTSSIVLVFRDAVGTTFEREVIVDPSGSNWFFASQPAVVWQRYGS